MYKSQTEIAKVLGMSNNQFRKMIEGRAEWKLVKNKRHYQMQEVLGVIKMAKVQQ